MENFNNVIDVIYSLMRELKNDLSGNEINTTDKPKLESHGIPVGISNRHIHLSQKELDILFGEGYKLNSIKELSQPGQYAAKETLTICGSKGAIEGVRILGPVRSKTQVEILMGDCFKLGIKAPVSMSGDLDHAAALTLVGPNGSVYLEHTAIVAKRHIHMTPQDASVLSVQDGDVVDVEISGERGGILSNVVIRVTDTSSLDFHLDIEEANALGLTSKSRIVIKNKSIRRK